MWSILPEAPEESPVHSTRSLVRIFMVCSSEHQVANVIIAGQTTKCLTAQSTFPEFTVTANTTDQLPTCDPWALTIQGGTSPYKVVLTSLDSPAVTNVTMPTGDNLYKYINRANPGGTLLGSHQFLLEIAVIRLIYHLCSGD
jgi:hypothetical protein